ncbi:MAG TPA: hypothetical protein VL588_12480, partial [Bdellovibrionota bacterium]|nr:hypothetical protein [Bdellovibrionota bacterium]
MPALGDEIKVEATLLAPTRPRISGLDWGARELFFEREGNSARMVPLVKIRGRFHRAGWTLMAGSQVLTLDANENFQINVEQISEITRVVVLALGPRGEVETERVLVSCAPDIWRYLKDPTARTPHLLSITAGLGATFLSYSENPRNVRLQEFALTPKAGATYPLIRGVLDVGGSLYFNVLSLSHTPASLNSATFLGINGRVGYTLPLTWAGATWKVMGGWYIWTMRTAGRFYGVDLL